MSEQAKKPNDEKAKRWSRLAQEIEARRRGRKALGVALAVVSVAGALIALALR